MLIILAIIIILYLYNNYSEKYSNSARTIVNREKSRRIGSSSIIDPLFTSKAVVDSSSIIDPLFKNKNSEIVDPSFMPTSSSIIDPLFKKQNNKIVDPAF